MRIDECFQLGSLGKPHGLQGNITAFIDADDPYQYQNMESVFVHQHGQLIPFFVEGININGNKAIISLEEISTVEEAAALTGHNLYLPLSMLPSLEDGQFYYHEIIGYTVTDTEAGELGKVVQVVSGAQELLVVESETEEILIPLHDHLVQEVNKEAQTVSVTLPDGLLDVYRNPSEQEEERDED